jgi:hypothetical protein
MLTSTAATRVIAAVANEQDKPTTAQIVAAQSRLRIWAQGGLLPDLPDAGPGRGRPRLLSKDAVRLAAVFNALADSGVTPARFSEIGRQIIRHPLWKEAANEKTTIGLIIVLLRDKTVVCLTEKRDIEKNITQCAPILILNISDLFQRVSSYMAEN